MTRPIVLWLKRDLRTADHAALARAMAMGPVLPLYVWEPDLWAQDDASHRQWAFVRESVAELRLALDALGLHLVERVGTATGVLADVHKQVPFDHMISHEETGNGWSYKRDLAVAAWARGTGVWWQEIAG
ncbi:MAG: deoxyribodipyrimidine photo-lyase, partial [Ascidiaceihabitans sp.]